MNYEVKGWWAGKHVESTYFHTRECAEDYMETMVNHPIYRDDPDYSWSTHKLIPRWVWFSIFCLPFAYVVIRTIIG